MIRRYHLQATAPTTRDDDWRTQARCADTDPDMWVPDGESWDKRRDITRALREICEACPVREACLQWALDVGDPHAFLGGMTPRQRYKLARKARA